MAHDIDTEPIIIRVPASVDVPPSTIPAAEWTEYKGRVAAQEGKALGDLADVDTAGAAEGLALIHDGEGWAPGTVTGAIKQVGNVGDFDFATDVEYISLRNGLRMVKSPNEGTIFIEGVFGTSADTVARGNHAHSIRPGEPFPFPATGSLSSGSRSLVSGTVTGLDPARTYVIWGTLKVQLRGEGTGAGYSTPRITINSNAVNDVEPVRTVSGVPHTAFMEHEGVSVTGVSSVAVSATLAYSSGDPIHVGAGKLVIRVDSNR